MKIAAKSMTARKPQLLAVVPPARPAGHQVRSSRTVAALRGGPGLRKLLGSAGELWTQLQTRCRRAPGACITVTARELAQTQRPKRPVRTIEWGLKRLCEAGLLMRSRTRYGVTLTLLAWDIDDNDVREFSPHLPAQTHTWMRGQKKRGRPRKITPAAPPTEGPRPLTPENLFMQQEVSALYGLDVTARILSHPLVPPSPYVEALGLPKTPPPLLLTAEARPSEHREFLIHAYVSASRAFYPRLAVQANTKFMRSRDGKRLLDAASSAFMEHSIAPQAWLAIAFEREVARKRKAPLRPEIVFEPSAIDQGAETFHSRAREHRMYLRETVRNPDHEVYFKGIRDMRALWERTVLELKQLPAYDEGEITRICTRYWPRGYQGVYASAVAKMHAIQNELETRVVRGDFIWGV